MEFEFQVDRVGFPLIWVESLRAYVHWFPVTKVQFEYFLWETESEEFDDEWYSRVRAVNPRVSPSGIGAGNYWQAFLTGILPDEAKRFAKWCGEEYSLPTLKEWQAAYRELSTRAPLHGGLVEAFTGLAPRCKLLIERLESAVSAVAQSLGRQLLLADQMAMRLGVLEWVAQADATGQWGAMGELSPAFHLIRAAPELGPFRPGLAVSTRSDVFGFRLLRRSR